MYHIFPRLISETLWSVEILKIRTPLYKISNIYIYNYAVYVQYTLITTMRCH